MKKTLLAALATAALVASCGIAPRAPLIPPFGVTYNDTTTMVDVTFDPNGEPEIGPKSGRAAVESYLNLVSIGDASVQAAAKAGGITRVTHIDSHIYNVLGFYQRYEIVVYGH